MSCFPSWAAALAHFAGHSLLLLWATLREPGAAPGYALTVLGDLLHLARLLRRKEQ